MELFMTVKRFSSVLATLATLLCAGMAMAAGTVVDKPAEVAERTPGAVKKAPVERGGVNAKAKPKATVKLVDINSANKAALMKLPGITAMDADKIIANRPYGSKTWLVTNQVIPEATFYGIKPLIEAKQPFKTAEENAAMYEKLKKEKKPKP
jgi:DNA uptake protein ComE-like DNA-binding protein